MTLVEFIRSRIVVDESGCWNWQGPRMRKGYGRVTWEHRNYSTHRTMYEAAKGPIPEGLHIDHLCRNPPCCNPDHLEAVTSAENTRRGMSAILNRLRKDQKTHCIHGHEYTPENSRFNKRGYRFCNTCEVSRQEAWNERRREQYHAAKVSA